DAPDDAVRAGALAVLGDVRRKRGDTPGARQAFVSALAAAGTAGVDRLTGEALRQLGLLDYFDGRLRSAEERFGQAHALARQVDDARGAGWALQHLAWSATTRGDYALAEQALEDAAEVFAGLEDTGGLSWVAGTEGFVRLLEGRLAEARELAGSVLPLGQAMGERWGVAALLTIDALAAAELGETDVATDEAQRAQQRFTEVGDVWGQALALVALGIAARRGSDPDRAAELLQEAAGLSESARHPLVTSLALVALGYAHLDRGDLEGAEGAVWRAQAVLGGLDLEPSAVLGAKVLLAQVLRRRGQLQEALRELDDALATTSGPALLFPRRQALAHRAGTLLDLGRSEEALAAAREAVALQSEDARSAVLALRAYGSALKACGQPDQAVAALREALALARATGMRHEAATTERLLAAAGSSS
ncbi:MAG: adenylate/guanylate cyclase with repeat, partial [Frankiales bacterium]|nr:adenylate/guanylate cyclase with repeat [Frankiales bacterium]